MSSTPQPKEFPDLSDPRYLDEVGYFLYYEKEMRWNFADYDDERTVYSRLHLKEILEFANEVEGWIYDKDVVNIGSGCSCAMLAWPSRSKISVDPLLGVYGRLGMLLEDLPETPPTIQISASAEDLPLVGESCDLVYCRNALNHMHRPEQAILEIARILRPGGNAYIDVDLDGDPTPDEPVSFAEEEVNCWVAPWFETLNRENTLSPFSIHSPKRLRLFLRRNEKAILPDLDKNALLAAYRVRIKEMESAEEAAKLTKDANSL